MEGGGDVTKITLAKATQGSGCHLPGLPRGTASQLRALSACQGGVSCTSCHSIHAGNTEDKLLKAAQPQLCFQCHTDVKPAFDMPFHHKVNEGLVKCSDCHDVHGTFGNNNIRSTADQNAICTKCHTENRGPFVYEHAAVKAEGCLACHTPHGSQNARLLNMPNINTLCNQCHSPVAAGTVHGMNAGSAELTPCISCHTLIHGSNINQAFIKVMEGRRAVRPIRTARPDPGTAWHRVQDFDVSNMFFQVRLHMKKIGWFSRLSNQQPSRTHDPSAAAGIGSPFFCDDGQSLSPRIRQPQRARSRMDIRSTRPLDLGGHMVGLTGSGRHVRHAGQHAVRAARAWRDL